MPETETPRAALRRRGRPPGGKSAETRGRIVHAARDVFSKKGFDAATFEAIATRAGLTRPAINFHFGGKRALYREVVDQTHATVLQASFELAEQQTTLLGQIGVFMASVLESDPQRTAAAFLVTTVLEAHRHPDLCGPDEDLVAKTRAFITKAVQEALERGELDPDTDVTSLVDMMLALLWGMGLYAGFVGTPEGLQGAVEQLRRLFVGELWHLHEALA